VIIVITDEGINEWSKEIDILTSSHEWKYIFLLTEIEITFDVPPKSTNIIFFYAFLNLCLGLSANNMTVAIYAVDILMSRSLYHLICWYILVV